jgi:hypothetical protein
LNAAASRARSNRQSNHHSAPWVHRQGANAGNTVVLKHSAQTPLCAERFEQCGYAVVQGGSDWVLGPNDLAIQDALLAGWAEVGEASAALAPGLIPDWLRRRRSHLVQGSSSLRVGHVDIFARPMTMR